ncbi:PROTEIN putative-RELATED [Salix koriyanagi]|nr:PROTEIN putative-RELATED [Salix koriyanagi]
MSSIGDDSSERSGIAHSSKFAHGSVYEGEHGGAAAGAADDTSNGGGDDHGSGAAVVTGAAMNNHTSNHRNAAGSHHANVMVLPILITTALVALIVHLSICVSLSTSGLCFVVCLSCKIKVSCEVYMYFVANKLMYVQRVRVTIIYSYQACRSARLKSFS